jgi:hypothetical protein
MWGVDASTLRVALCIARRSVLRSAALTGRSPGGPHVRVAGRRLPHVLARPDAIVPGGSHTRARARARRLPCCPSFRGGTCVRVGSLELSTPLRPPSHIGRGPAPAPPPSLRRSPSEQLPHTQRLSHRALMPGFGSPPLGDRPPAPRPHKASYENLVSCNHSLLLDARLSPSSRPHRHGALRRAPQRGAAVRPGATAGLRMARAWLLRAPPFAAKGGAASLPALTP